MDHLRRPRRSEVQPFAIELLQKWSRPSFGFPCASAVVDLLMPGADVRLLDVAPAMGGFWIAETASQITLGWDWARSASLRNVSSWGRYSALAARVASWLKIASRVRARAVSSSSTRQRSPDWTAFAWRVSSAKSVVGPFLRHARNPTRSRQPGRLAPAGPTLALARCSHRATT